MSYLKNLRSDIKQHEKYHERCLNGRDWNQHWGDEVMRFNNNEYIVRVNPAKQAEVNTALELLEVVNKDLNAPDDNEFWLSTQDKGFVYLYVKNKVAVGLVSIIRITQGKWFSIEDGKIVSDKNMNLLAGISRIYVCTNYRRQGIGLKLLQSVQESLVYGMTVPKLLIGWSQPSTSGAKLASAFNSVHHKSGKTLVPVYIE
jgi:N-acetyltransferase